MSRFAKNLVGQSEKVIIVPASSVTSSATFAAFVASSDADGTGSFFLADGTKKTTAQAAGEIIFFAQKRDGQVWRTPSWKYEDIVAKREQLYTAPVKQISSIGYNTTTTTNNIFPTASPFSAASATNTLTFGVTVRETTPGNQPFPVQEGYATVNSSTAVQYDVVASIVAQLNADYDYFREAPDPFVIAEIETNAATAALTGTATTVAVVNKQKDITFNGTATNIAVGTYISLSGVMYKCTAVSGNVRTLDRPFTGTSNSALAVANVLILTYVDGTTKMGIRFTAILNESTFVLAGNTGLIGAFTQTTTAFVLGAGYGSNIVEIEKQGSIFDGVGSTLNVAFKEDYGQPTALASSTETYDQWFVEVAMPIVPSANPLDIKQSQMMRLHFAAGKSSGGMSGTSGTIATVLGL